MTKMPQKRHGLLKVHRIFQIIQPVKEGLNGQLKKYLSTVCIHTPASERIKPFSGILWYNRGSRFGSRYRKVR